MLIHVATVILLFFLFSCSSSADLYQSNEKFIKKYEEEVQKINEQRKPQEETKKEVIILTPPTTQEVTEELASKVEYYPYVDIAQLGDAPKQSTIPNRETYEQVGATTAASLPASIFEINYNLALYPPFHKPSAEFDAINVPEYDAFGVPTALSNKSYLLVGNDVLQSAVDSINSQKTKSNIEISKMLIAEKKKMQRQDKIKQVFGDRLELVSSTPDNIPESTVKTEAPTQQNSVAQKATGFIRSVVKNQ